MKIKLLTIPNLLTLSNLLCGSFAAVSALVYGDLSLAFLLIVLAAVFDFLDGFVARLLHQSSPIGLQLDSLSDDVTFGFAPAAVLFVLFGRMPGVWVTHEAVGLGVFFFTACAALRLAKFNIDDTQHTEFCGLPSPAAALCCASLGVIVERYDVALPAESVLVLAVVTGLLMVSDIRMFAFKFQGFGWRGNELRYAFVAVSLLALIVLHWAAVPLLVLLYVAVSTLLHLLRRAGKEQQIK